MFSHTSWFVCPNVDANKVLCRETGAIPLLIGALRGGDERTLRDAMRALRNLTFDSMCNHAAAVVLFHGSLIDYLEW